MKRRAMLPRERVRRAFEKKPADKDRYGAVDQSIVGVRFFVD